MSEQAKQTAGRQRHRSMWQSAKGFRVAAHRLQQARLNLAGIVPATGSRVKGLSVNLSKAIPVTAFLLVTLLSPLLVSASTVSRPQGIRTLFYSKGVMERVARNHQNPRFPPGDYVPTLRLTPAELRGCLVAVNWQSRAWVAQNTRLTIDFWHPRRRVWVRKVCRPADWQQQRHSTGSRQRFELDYETAVEVGAYPNNTVARLVRVER